MTNKINLNDLTTEDLENELVRRKDRRANRPVSLSEPNFEPVKKFAEAIIKTIDEKSYSPKDYKRHMTSLVMETVFGPQVFTWINTHDKS